MSTTLPLAGIPGAHIARHNVAHALVSPLTPAQVDAEDEEHNTPLHLAAVHGSSAVVQSLVNRQANASAKNDHGSTPLHLAFARNERRTWPPAHRLLCCSRVRALIRIR